MLYSICTITRDFLQINDFVEYHLDIGFDRIVLYDNYSNPPVDIQDDRVEIIRWNREIISCNAYNDYAVKNRHIAGWTAYIDEDEFINTNGRNIKEAMLEFQDFDTLALSWRLFGDKIDDGDEVETKFWKKYKYYVPSDEDPYGINNHQKVICKNTMVQRFENPHYAILESGKQSKNVYGEIVNGPFSRPIHEKIWIDHFHCRGFEDYLRRKSIKVAGVCATVEQITSHYHKHSSSAIRKL
jgi:hypothetical protein